MPIAMLADPPPPKHYRVGDHDMVGYDGHLRLCCSYSQLALARIGVGIGETGSSPPSHSMISDLFPQRQRAAGDFRLGITSLLIAYLSGGWMSEHWGWRRLSLSVCPAF